MGDIPVELQADVRRVFKFGPLIPIQWIDEVSKLKFLIV